MDALLMMAGAFVVGAGLGWALGAAHAKADERLRVVEWLKAASGPTDNYPSKLADLIALGAHIKPVAPGKFPQPTDGQKRLIWMIFALLLAGALTIAILVFSGASIN